MKYEIKGCDLPYVECTLNAGEKMITESGSMCWMDDGITMETSTNGGFSKGLGRLFSGENFFQNNYTATSDNLKISFSSSMPGTIIAVPITEENSLIIQKKSFLAAHGNINISIFLNKKIGSGLFGGEGFILQKISGNGTVFLEVDGAYAEYELHPNQKLIVSSEHLVSISETCQMDIQVIKGFKNIFFGNEGLFNNVITGPGKVSVQSMPIRKLADSISPYLKIQNNSSNTSKKQ